MSDEYKRYMRDEWAQEKRGDVPLFEKLCLEGAQAGLSWATILAKREGYRTAFHEFDISKCAAMTAKDVDRLLSAESATIVRHRGKVESVVHNAKCAQKLIAEMEAQGKVSEHGHLDSFLWSFVDGTPVLNEWADAKSIPSESPVADVMSKELKARGLKFVGPKICYSLMQSCGLIIDHPKGTPEWEASRQRLEGRGRASSAASNGAKASSEAKASRSMSMSGGSSSSREKAARRRK